MMKTTMILVVGVLLNGCTVLSTVDTAIDIALLPVKVGVATAEAVIPDGDVD